MTKQEFIDRVADQTSLSSATPRRPSRPCSTIKSTLIGGDISFTGFGKFHVAERGPRQGVNPQTKERIMIPGGKVPRFTAGSAQEAVKEAEAVERFL